MSRAFLDLGDGMEIRVLEPADASALFALIVAERDRLRSWMPWADTTRSVGDVRSFIEHARATEDLDGLGIFVGGALVGGIGLLLEASGVGAELGCWVAERHEGRGVASRALGGLIDHAFGELGLHRVSCLVAEGNDRSHRFVQRLGFVREGLVREGARGDGGGYRDLVLYGLLEGDRSR